MQIPQSKGIIIIIACAAVILLGGYFVFLRKPSDTWNGMTPEQRETTTKQMQTEQKATMGKMFPK